MMPTRGGHSMPGARYFATLLTIIAAALLGAVVASAVGPMLTGAQTGGQIHGCVNNYTGALRIVPAANRCSGSERPLSWSQYLDGGVADVQIVSESEVVETVDEKDSLSMKAICPAGYIATGGGGGLGTSVGNDIWTPTISEPFQVDDGPPTGWKLLMKTVDGEYADGQYHFFVEAICVLTT